MKLSGKRALITGASQGLGLEIAKSFLKNGADVFLCSRSQAELEKRVFELGYLRRNPSQRIEFQAADISAESDVGRLAHEVRRRLDGIDILVANAGVYGPKGPFELTPWKEWVDAININFYGTALCCKIFLPLLRESRRGKILVLSGGGATKPLPFLSAYASSKTAVVRFAETLALEVQQYGIDVNSIAPGALNTRLLDEILEAGPDLVGADFYSAALAQKSCGGTPLERGASLSVYLASDESNGITGKLISAIWDPWEKFNDLRSDLSQTDIYTLRRITPKDRNLPWE